MKRSWLISAMFGLSLSASALANGYGHSYGNNYGYDDQDEYGNGYNHHQQETIDHIDGQVTHYCWVKDPNGGVVDGFFFGAWLNIPAAQQGAIEHCVGYYNENYCRANVSCMVNNPNDEM